LGSTPMSVGAITVSFLSCSQACTLSRALLRQGTSLEPLSFHWNHYYLSERGASDDLRSLKENKNGYTAKIGMVGFYKPYETWLSVLQTNSYGFTNHMRLSLFLKRTWRSHRVLRCADAQWRLHLYA
jgi:hypothetical protein